MLDIKNNLNKRICDCEKDATNEQTYFEYIIDCTECIWNIKLSDKDKEDIRNKTNEELNDILEEIDWLIVK